MWMGNFLLMVLKLYLEELLHQRMVVSNRSHYVAADEEEDMVF